MIRGQNVSYERSGSNKCDKYVCRPCPTGVEIFDPWVRSVLFLEEACPALPE